MEALLRRVLFYGIYARTSASPDRAGPGKIPISQTAGNGMQNTDIGWAPMHELHGSLNKTAAARRKVKNESAQEYAGCNVLADLIKLK